MDVLSSVEHRPYVLPAGQWRMAQRWNDLLFAHWPIAVEAMARLLPAGLEVDIFDGWAWVGVVPFWMDRVRTRALGQRCVTVPSTGKFCELNLRTYVRSRVTGLRGVYFFSLDAASALAVAGARALFHLPYFPASMRREISADGSIEYRSRRLLTRESVRFEANYRGSGEVAGPSVDGTLEYFLTERYCLFTPHGGKVLVGHIHHLPWPLERAEAEIRVNELPAAHGITLPERAPVLHFARELHVYIWSLREDL
ncbi:YqjF family protein [Tunturiibacter psychrotolerans]|uniref:YqjF family protein n=1 Tax=Tunturiibacter psychrotolerans TaxID=3069686 RepID=UPI003D19B7C5